MEFLNRIKKEMSEGIVKAILEHYGYRVIDTGIEKVIREISFLPQHAYLALEFPDAIRKLPDFVVMNEKQDKKILLDVKYRGTWDGSLLLDENVINQVRLFREIILIVVNGNPPPPPKGRNSHNPAAYIRCVGLKEKEGNVFVKKRMSSSKSSWVEIKKDVADSFNWFANFTLGEIFPAIRDEYNNDIIKSSVEALSGIIKINK